MVKRAIFLLGPTGSGKSRLALALAKKINGEIVSCDSMQVYRGMDIGTAKPTSAERKTIRHHLIDLISPRQECSVFKHRALALKAIQSILAKGRVPIVVGGSGLYLKAILDGLSPQPGKNLRMRKRLESIAKQRGLSFLYQELKKADLERARQIHPQDKRRIIRALEICASSRPARSEEAPGRSGLISMGIKPYVFGIIRERKELYERIERRVDRMLDEGWIDEARQLKRSGLSQTAAAAIGYREIFEYLEGKMPLADAVSEIKKRTRHLAKKQMTWFCPDKRIHWIPIRGERFLSDAVRTITKSLQP